nr:collagen alpha 1(XXII) chain [Hymenolepis microstoma]
MRGRLGVQIGEPEQGPKGERGPVGPPGESDLPSPQGLKGEPGSVGFPCISGVQGLKGRGPGASRMRCFTTSILILLQRCVRICREGKWSEIRHIALKREEGKHEYAELETQPIRPNLIRNPTQLIYSPFINKDIWEYLSDGAMQATEERIWDEDIWSMLIELIVSSLFFMQNICYYLELSTVVGKFALHCLHSESLKRIFTADILQTPVSRVTLVVRLSKI